MSSPLDIIGATDIWLKFYLDKVRQSKQEMQNYKKWPLSKERLYCPYTPKSSIHSNLNFSSHVSQSEQKMVILQRNTLLPLLLSQVDIPTLTLVHMIL